MKKHTRLYLKECRYDLSGFIPSELGGIGVDIHHILSRGRGGKDRIENLMCLTREQHILYGDKKKWMVFLLQRHRDFLRYRKASFDNEWFEDMISKY